MARIAENTVIVDGQEYKPGDMIPDFKSIKCVDTREPRKYQGLSADVSVLNDVIAKYASGGASCFMSDTGEYYEYDRKEKTWKLITNITERGFDSEKAYGALKHMLKNVTVSDEKIQSAVTDYLTVNPVLPGATTEQAQQIEQNKADVASLKEETGSLKEDLTSKADKTALAQTDRKLDALWKLNQGISYKFEEDNTEAYQKTVPSGAKMVSIKSIGGKTIVWNQLIDETYGESVTRGNVTIVNNKDGSYTVFTNGAATETVTVGVYFLKANRDAGKYYLKGSPSNGKEIGYSLSGTYIWKPEYDKADYGNGVIIDDNVFLNNSDIVRIKVNEGTVISTPIVFKPQLFNLTKMFGSGNEPSTPEEFEAMFPTDYYPYNVGELMSASVNTVIEQGNNSFDLFKFTLLPGTIKFVDDVLIANGVNHEWFNTGINGTAKAGDVISYEVKTGTAVNVRFRSLTPDGYKDITPSITSSEWKEVRAELTYDISRLYLNWTTGGSFSIRNFRINGKKYKDPITIQIPQTILDRPGYGWSAGDVYNYVDWESKKYIQRVAAVDLGTLNWTYMAKYTAFMANVSGKADGQNMLCSMYINYGKALLSSMPDMYICANSSGEQIFIKNSKYTDADTFKQAMNGVMLYYKFAEPIITDISDIVDNTFQDPVEVEAGGTLTFKNSHGDDYRIPVPSSEEYVISLAEVAK